VTEMESVTRGLGERIARPAVAAEPAFGRRWL